MFCSSLVRIGVTDRDLKMDKRKVMKYKGAKMRRICQFLIRKMRASHMILKGFEDFD